MTNASQGSLVATLDAADAKRRTWDAIVVGAGPAGALAARQLALSGADTLLMDRAHFPRWKVCGCCLNGAALASLAAVGLADIPERLGAAPLTSWCLCSGGRRARCSLPAGVSLSREAFDAELIRAAMEAGAAFLPGAPATLLPQESEIEHRTLEIVQGDNHWRLTGRVVLAADGLAGRFLDQEQGMEPVVDEQARLGAGAVIADGEGYEPHTIYMACGRNGYVGLVRLEDGRLDIAAAFDRSAMREAGSPAALAEQILQKAKLPTPRGLAEAVWKGTPGLTRRRAVAGRRLLVLGDAAGYIEPFTGEGMAWALQSAAAAAPLAIAGLEQWSSSLEDRWESVRKKLLSRRQRTCRYVGALLRRPRLAKAVITALRYAPWLATPVIRAVNAPPE